MQIAWTRYGMGIEAECTCCGTRRSGLTAKGFGFFLREHVCPAA